MDALPDITTANRAIRRYLAHADGKLPADTFKRLEDLADSPSPVDTIVNSAELLYARRDELDDEGRTIVGQLSAFAGLNGWHGMGGAGNRGGLIAQAMQRDLKVRAPSGGWPKRDADPDSRPEYAAKPAE